MKDPRINQAELPIEDNNFMEMSLTKLANFVVYHQHFELIFKSILHKALTGDLQHTEDTINEVVANHAAFDAAETQFLDVKVKE